MDAIVLGVMESWPLQLSLATEGGTEQVALDEGTLVTRAGRKLDPGALRPGQRVRVVIREPEGGEHVAISVEIID